MKFQKKSIIAVLAGVVIAGALSASAATLGGIARAELGADANDVASPVTGGVTVTWETEYSTAASAYVVTDIELDTVESEESIPGNAEVKLAVTGKTGDLLGELTSTDGGSTWSGPASILAEDVYGLAVVINGGTVTVG